MGLPSHIRKQFTAWAIEKKIPLTCSREARSNRATQAPTTCTMNDKQMADQLTGFPMIALFCGNCGYVRLFSTVVIGISPKPYTAN